MKFNRCVNTTDPNGIPVGTFHINIFGYEMWFHGKTMKKHLRCMRLAARIYRKAQKAKHQLLDVQKLVNAINGD